MKERIIEILANEIGMDKKDITLDKKIIEDLGADSLSVVQTVMLVEEEFGVQIPEEEIEKLVTVADLVNYIDKKAE